MMPQIPRQGLMPRLGPQRMGLGMGGRAPMAGMNRAAGSPFMGMGGPQQASRGGGLFSRLLGRGNPASNMGGLMGMPQAGRAAGAGGSILGGNGGGGVMNFLNNTQQFLRTAQSIGPMVQQFQQYGSLVKNIPAIWKLYRGLKDAPDDNETESKNSSKKNKEESSSSEKETNSKSGKRKSKSSSKNSSSREAGKRTESGKSKKGKQVSWKKNDSKAPEKGSSTPKLYI